MTGFKPASPAAVCQSTPFISAGDIQSGGACPDNTYIDMLKYDVTAIVAALK